MSKAFNKVWHEGLLFKLKQNGVDGKLLDLLQNYLKDRKQRVVLNGVSSQWESIKSSTQLKFRNETDSDFLNIYLDRGNLLLSILVAKFSAYKYFHLDASK